MIEIRELKKSYQSIAGDSVVVLDNVSLSLESRGFVTFVGESGSGKSTLLRIIASLENFDSGEVSVDGRSISLFTKDEEEIYRSKLFFMFQEDFLIDEMNVSQNIKFYSSLKNKKIKIDEALSSVFLEGKERRKITELSGGERKRVELASLFETEDAIIICDEPTASLDNETSKSIFSFLKNLSKDNLVIVATHQEELVEDYSDEIYRIEKQSVIEIKHRDKESNSTNITKALNGRTNFKAVWSLSWALFKSKKLKTAISIVFTAICLFCLGVFVSAYNQDAPSSVVINSPYDTLTIQKVEREHLSWHRPDQYYTYDKHFSEDNIAELNDRYRSGFLPAYQADLEKYYGSVPLNSPYQENSISLLAADAENLGFDLLSGRYPQRDNDILITDYILQGYQRNGFYYKGDDLVTYSIDGNEIDEDNIIGRKIENYTICGVLDTGYDGNEFSPIYQEEASGSLIAGLDAISESSYFNTAFVTKGELERYIDEDYSRDSDSSSVETESSIRIPSAFKVFSSSNYIFLLDGRSNIQQDEIVVPFDSLSSLARTSVSVTIDSSDVPSSYQLPENYKSSVYAFVRVLQEIAMCRTVEDYADTFYSEDFYHSFVQNVSHNNDREENLRFYINTIQNRYTYVPESRYLDWYNRNCFTLLEKYVPMIVQSLEEQDKGILNAGFTNDRGDKKTVQIAGFYLGRIRLEDSTVLVNSSDCSFFNGEEGDEVYDFAIGRKPSRTSVSNIISSCSPGSFGNENVVSTGLDFIQPSYSMAVDVLSEMNNLGVTFLVVAFIFLALSLIFLILQSVSLISDKSALFGYLLSIGMTRKEAVFSFAIESLLLGLLDFMLSSVMLFSTSPLINMAINNMTGTAFSLYFPSVLSIAIALVISILVPLLSILVPAIRMTRRTPSDLLYKRKGNTKR